tara:strand:- start:235 stop:498 length:264 start_codon:yes stop_codon:yes gene_type:complete
LDLPSTDVFIEELNKADSDAAKNVGELELKANAGDVEAQLKLVRAYWVLVILARGETEEKMKKESLAWYEKVARQQSDSSLAIDAVE